MGQESTSSLLPVTLLENHAQAGDVDGLVVAIRRAAAQQSTSAHRRSLELLLRAIRIDRAFLAAHPQLLFQTLWNRCGWYGQQLSELWYSDMASAETSPELHAPEVILPLQALLRAWHKEKQHRTPRFFWVRSLRPPEFSLDSPLVAEVWLNEGIGAKHIRFAPSADLIELDHHVVDLQSGKIHVGNPQPIRSQDSAQDGRWRIHCGSWGEDSCVLNSATGEVVARLPIPDPNGTTNRAAVSPDGRIIAISGSFDEYSDGFVCLFDARSFKKIRHVTTIRPAYSLGFSADGSCIATGTAQGVVVFSTLKSDLFRVFPFAADSFALSASGDRLATVAGRLLRVWDMAEPKWRCQIQDIGNGSSGLMLSPDQRWFMSGHWLFNAQNGAPVRKLTISSPQYLEGGPPRDCFKVGNQWIVYIGHAVKIWDSATGAQLANDPRRYSQWHTLAISDDGRRYAVSPPNGTLTTRDFPEYKVDGAEGTIAVRDSQTGKVLCRLSTNEKSSITNLKFSPDGTILAGASATGRLWLLSEGIHSRELPGHRAKISDLAFSADGRRLVSAGRGERLRMWDTESGTEVVSCPVEERDVEGHHYIVNGQRITDWRASRQALAALAGWGGFVSAGASHRWRVAAQDSVSAFIDEADRARAFYPTSQRLESILDARNWVGGSLHLRVEGMEP
jgi:WD40 repeat protein